MNWHGLRDRHVVCCALLSNNNTLKKVGGFGHHGVFGSTARSLLSSSTRRREHESTFYCSWTTSWCSCGSSDSMPWSSLWATARWQRLQSSRKYGNVWTRYELPVYWILQSRTRRDGDWDIQTIGCTNKRFHVVADVGHSWVLVHITILDATEV